MTHSPRRHYFLVAIPRLGCNEDSIFFVGGFEPERPDPWSAAAFFSSLGQVIADVHGLFDWLVAMLSSKSSMLMEADGLDACSAKAGSEVSRAGAACATRVITARRSHCPCGIREAYTGSIQIIIRVCCLCARVLLIVSHYVGLCA
jgi:hypothetical protein